MRKFFITVTITSFFFTGCKDEVTTKESTPKFTDVENIIINGEKISASEYADRYCRDKVKETFQDHSRCGEAINFALSEARSKSMQSINEAAHAIAKREYEKRQNRKKTSTTESEKQQQ